MKYRQLVLAFVILSELDPIDRELWYDYMVLERPMLELAVEHRVTRSRIHQRIDRARIKIRLLRYAYE